MRKDPAGNGLRQRTFAETAPARPAGESAPYYALDAYIVAQMRRLNIPGTALVVVEGDEIVHLRGFGRARPGGEAPSPQTPFPIGSLTKSFTALAVMQLVEAGQIDLDVPVQRYLPWFRVADPQASAQITVRHLLNQTSGLPQLAGLINLANLDDRPGAVERQARALSTLRLTRPVGSRFEYSNLNYNLLGLVVEAASGESYADYIQRQVFDPVGMSHSFTSQAAARQDGLAVGYRSWFSFPIALPSLPLPSGSLPSGQLISSAEDMGHYLIAHLNEGHYDGAQILSGAGIDELHRPAAEIIEMGRSFGHYGMGWISEGDGASRIVSHSGTLPDFFAFMALIPEQGRGMALLGNVNSAAMKMTLDAMGMGAAQRLAGVPPSSSSFERIFDAAPWVMRGLLLVPILQIVGVACTMRLLRRWREAPQRRPSQGRLWRRHILLPLIPNLSLVAVAVSLLASKMRGFLMLYVPDFSWLALISGGFAGVWTFLRTSLILRAFREPSRGQQHE